MILTISVIELSRVRPKLKHGPFFPFLTRIGETYTSRSFLVRPMRNFYFRPSSSYRLVSSHRSFTEDREEEQRTPCNWILAARLRSQISRVIATRSGSMVNGTPDISLSLSLSTLLSAVRVSPFFLFLSFSLSSISFIHVSFFIQLGIRLAFQSIRKTRRADRKTVAHSHGLSSFLLFSHRLVARGEASTYVYFPCVYMHTRYKYEDSNNVDSFTDFISFYRVQ